MATFAQMAGSQCEESRAFSPPLSSPARLRVKSTGAPTDGIAGRPSTGSGCQNSPGEDNRAYAILSLSKDMAAQTAAFSKQ